MADKKRGRGRPPKKQEISPEIHLPDLEDTSSQHSFKDSKSLVHPSASAVKKDGKGSSSLNPSPLQLIREALEKDKNKRSLKKNSKDRKKMNVFELESDDEDPVPNASAATGKKMARQARRTKASDDSAGKGGKGEKMRLDKKTKGASPAVGNVSVEEEPPPKKRDRSSPAKKAAAKPSPRQTQAKGSKSKCG